MTTTRSLPSSYNDESSSNETDPLLGGGAQQIEHVDTVTTTVDTTTVGGTLCIAIGAFFFAATNGAATALYRRNGATVVSLYIIRSPIIYLVNAGIVAIQNQKKSSNSQNSSTKLTMTATDIIFLRTGSRTVSKLILLRSLLNAIKAVLLSVGFVFMTYSDAFVIFKGVAVCGVVLVSRLLLGPKESLSHSELCCGLGVLLGILMIVPPTSLVAWFTTSTNTNETSNSTAADIDIDTDIDTSAIEHQQTVVGIWIVILSGLMSSVSGTIVRMVSESGGKHTGHAPPAMLLSYLMVVMFVVNGVVVLGSAAVDFASIAFVENDTDHALLSQQQPLSLSSSSWSWTKFVIPTTSIDYSLIMLNCFCTLCGQLATAYGYTTTKAGIVAFLQLTEIPWVYVLDVSRENYILSYEVWLYFCEIKSNPISVVMFRFCYLQPFSLFCFGT